MFTIEEHIDDLVRHLNLVRDACLLMGKRLICEGEEEKNQDKINLGIKIIARGFNHDPTKFFGIEFDFLHAGSDIPIEKLNSAIKQHTVTNDHHVEYWGSIENMPKECIAEMVCDCYARGQERGTNTRQWFLEEAVPKYNIDTDSKQWKWIQECLNLLLQTSFNDDLSIEQLKPKKKKELVKVKK